MLTAVLAIAGVAVAMGLIGLGVLLRKRTPLKRSCHGIEAGVEGEGGRCEGCGCIAEEPEIFDER